MSLARRFVAAVLLVVMVPSLVLAATPVRYCVGPSGHRAFEFVIDGVSHGGNHLSHGSVTQDAAECDDGGAIFAVVDEGKCNDNALMDTASPPPIVELKFISLSALLAQVSIPTDLLSPLLFEREPTAVAHHPQIDPRIGERRTIVLRI